jgi:hypothetical protein
MTKIGKEANTVIANVTQQGGSNRTNSVGFSALRSLEISIAYPGNEPLFLYHLYMISKLAEK